MIGRHISLKTKQTGMIWLCVIVRRSRTFSVTATSPVSAVRLAASCRTVTMAAVLKLMQCAARKGAAAARATSAAATRRV